MELNELFAGIFEFLYYKNPFSDDIYEFKLYASIGLFLLLTTLFIVIIYYYVINHPRFNKWYHWLIVGGITVVSNFIYTLIIPKNEFEIQGLEYGNEHVVLSIVCSIYCFIFFVILSFAFRWKSRNCSKTPL